MQGDKLKFADIEFNWEIHFRKYLRNTKAETLKMPRITERFKPNDQNNPKAYPSSQKLHDNPKKPPRHQLKIELEARHLSLEEASKICIQRKRLQERKDFGLG